MTIANNQFNETRKALVKTAQETVATVSDLPAGIAVYEMVGAAKAISHLTSALRSQLIIALETFQREEGYRKYGCKTFVEFLQLNPQLDVNKDQYYREKELLQREGEDTFNLLMGLNVPLKHRLALTAGDIEMTGEEIVIKGKTAKANDPKAVKELFKQVSAAFQDLEAQTSKEIKHLKKQMKRGGFTFGKDEEGKELITPPPAQAPVFSKHEGGDEINHLYLVATAALNELTSALEEIPAEEAKARLGEYRPALQTAFAQLMQADKTERAPASSGKLADLLSDEDLSDLLDEED